MRIESEESTNKEIRTFTADFPLTDAILKRIESIEGVESLGSCLRYTAVVHRGALFSWDDVEPRVRDVLRQGSDSLAEA